MFQFNHKLFKPFKSSYSFLCSSLFSVLLIALSSLFFVNIAHGFDRTFAWDANTEPELAGYRVYYKSGASGHPYDGTGAVEGNSPIEIPLTSLNDPENPEITLHGLSDSHTYYFVATAYDIYGLESYDSNELSSQSARVSAQATDASGGGGGCFIATAAFGSKFEKHVRILQRFRDVYLMPYKIGRHLVKAYYRYSPPIADLIASHNTLRMLVRWSLVPLIGFSWMLLHLGALPTMMILVVVGSGIWLCSRKLKFRRSATDN